MIPAVEHASDVAASIVERHMAVGVGMSTGMIGVTLGVVDGWSTTTVAATSVLGFTLGVVGLVVRVLLTDIRQLRLRVRQLETELDHRREVVEAERAELIDRIHQLEQRLVADDGR